MSAKHGLRSEPYTYRAYYIASTSSSKADSTVTASDYFWTTDMTHYEPGKIYICLIHQHRGHYYLTPKGKWRFYDRKYTTWYNSGPDLDNCTLVLFQDPM